MLNNMNTRDHLVCPPMNTLLALKHIKSACRVKKFCARNSLKHPKKSWVADNAHLLERRPEIRFDIGLYRAPAFQLALVLEHV